MLKKDINILIPLVKELESYIALRDKKKETVSKSDVAWQIDHTLKVINLVIDSVANSNPENYKWRFNKYRTLFFMLGFFPRGKVRAPKIVRPPEKITLEDLDIQVSHVNQNLERFHSLEKNMYFSHFIFGQLNKNKTIRFLQIHTNHHLKIIRDILK